MFNITLASLQLFSLYGTSPLITRSFYNFDIKNSYFHKSTVSILNLHSFSHLSLQNSQFTKFSMAPIYISGLDYRNHSFVNHTNWSNETTVSLTKCLFLNCQNSDPINKNGGAILMDVPSSQYRQSLLSINCSGFANCSTGGKGGAIYCTTENITLLKTCFQNCVCKEHIGEILYLDNKNEIDLNYIEITNTVDKEDNSCLICSKALLKNVYNTINISNSNLQGGITFESHITEVSFFSVSNINCDSLFSISKTALLLSNCNINNASSGTAFIHSEASSILIIYSLFLETSSKLIEFDNRTTYQFISVFVGNEVTINNLDDTTGLTKNNDATPFSQFNINTDYCWLGQATWDTTQIKFKLSGASISFAVICFIVLCIYIYLKNKINQPLTDDDINPKRRKSSDWNEIEEPDEEEILVINEEHPEEEEKENENKSKAPSKETANINDNDDGEDGEIKLEDIRVEQTGKTPQPNNNNNNTNTYN